MPEALFQISEPGEARAKEACVKRVVGIDLGTTNSLVAAVREGKPVCLPVEGGDVAAPGTARTMLPSVVHFDAGGGIVVGRRARDELASRYPQDTIASVKRFVGRGPRDAEATRKLTPYRFAPAAAGEGVVRFLVAGDRAVTPIEVSAEILKALRARAEEALGGPIDGAVITVPAYFDDAQRQATRDAGRLAGLEVLRLVNEPTAAALAYGLDRQATGMFAVFDLGGGTYDVSILKLEDGVFEVRATGGDSMLGGDDFDRTIAAALLSRMERPADAAGDRALARRVLDAARAAKERLTLADETRVEVSLGDGRSFATTLTRAEMEDLVRPVLGRCAGPARRALKDAGIAAAALDGVVLVGGATRMPIVRRFVRELFGREPLHDVDPDQVVALGAAIQAEVLAGRGAGEVVLLDVVPLSLGLELMGGVVERVIPRNTTVPCGAKQVFTTYADRQTGFDLHVVQGERELASDCRSLARFKLGGLPPLPAGMARLEVSFVVDADGLLRVSAKELTTGQATAIEVKPSYGLSEEELERMLHESIAHAEDDVRMRLLASERVEAHRILAATRAALAASSELLAPEEQPAIDAAIAALELAAADEDHRAIRARIEALDEATKGFATRRMNRALEHGIAGRRLDDVETKLRQGAG